MAKHYFQSGMSVLFLIGMAILAFFTLAGLWYTTKFSFEGKADEAEHCIRLKRWQVYSIRIFVILAWVGIMYDVYRPSGSK